MIFDNIAAEFSDEHAAKLADWRGYSPETVAYLREKKLIGIYESNLAFATEGGAHYRLKDGSWRFTPGAKPSPFLLGEIEEGAHVHVFESQFDAIAFADSQGERNNIVASRGASNAKLIVEAVGQGFTGTLYAWCQNDDPGQKWLQDLRRLFPGQMKLCVVPSEHKDVNEWRKAGATDGALLNACFDAKDFPYEDKDKVQASKRQDIRPLFGDKDKTEESQTLGENAKDAGSKPATGSGSQGQDSQAGQVRDVSTGDATQAATRPSSGLHHATDGGVGLPNLSLKTSSTVGGETNLSGGVESRHAISEGRHGVQVPLSGNEHELSSAASGSSAPPAQPITSLAQALDAITALLCKYIRFESEWQPHLASLWCAHTWVFTAFDATPYLHIFSPEKRCGKSHTLKCLVACSARPQKAGNYSEAAIYRSIENETPTLFFDEIDKVFGANKDNIYLRQLLNSGYESDGVVIRCDGMKHVPKEYRVYCPKAMAGIGRNSLDGDTGDRSIHLPLSRQPSNDKAAKFRKEEVTAMAEPIRVFFAVWMKESIKILRRARPTFPAEITDGRHEDMIEPLLAIADLASPEWAERARDATVQALAQPEDTSLGERLLRDLRSYYLTKSVDKMPTIEALEWLVSIEQGDAPWSTMWEHKMRNNETRGPARALAGMLDHYGIHPRDMSTNDGTRKGYYQADFDRAWRIYLPSETKAETMELKLLA